MGARCGEGVLAWAGVVVGVLVGEVVVVVVVVGVVEVVVVVGVVEGEVVVDVVVVGVVVGKEVVIVVVVGVVEKGVVVVVTETVELVMGKKGVIAEVKISEGFTSGLTVRVRLSGGLLGGSRAHEGRGAPP